MKTLSADLLCCRCKLYKIGISIGLIYLIPNIYILARVFGSGSDAFLPLMCALTMCTSLLLIKGLKEENHRLLKPWLANIGVLILFNIIFLVILFQELNRKETKELFYLQFGVFIVLELQILFWIVIFCLFKKGYQKNKILTGPITSISKILEAEKSDYYKVNSFGNDQLIGEKKVASV